VPWIGTVWPNRALAQASFAAAGTVFASVLVEFSVEVDSDGA
jgi:hypothetical protein